MYSHYFIKQIKQNMPPIYRSTSIEISFDSPIYVLLIFV